MIVKTRFAPSPTGFLHIGGLRTALFAYLFAKNQGGKFLLRIEDTDRERYVEGGVENILHSLYWAGLAPDQGVMLDEQENIIQVGQHGPYIQSKRLAIYKKYVNQLINDNHAYYCFCTKERLGELRQQQMADRVATGYDGYCRNISLSEAKKRIEQGEPYVVRMKMPLTGMTEFKDLVRDQVEFKNNLIDDQVLLKADGYPTYHLAVVVDDHLMDITHVIRGEEWLPSTPKHIQLYKMFGWEVPQYAHLSLLVNKKKQKLSKRHGHVSVCDYINQGYLPEALVNFIAFLGWNPGDEREIFSLAELIKEFSFDKISKAAAVFNLEKLDWYNGQYIRAMNLAELTERCRPFLVNAGAKIADKAWLEKVVALDKNRLVKLSDLPEAAGFILTEKLAYDSDLLVWRKSAKEQIRNNLAKLKVFLDSLTDSDWSQAALQARVGEWVEKNNLTNGEVLWPMRVALSGQKNSPGPFEIANVLGKEVTLKRLEQAISLL